MALNIKVSRQEFMAALAPIQGICGKNGTMAILANVLVETGEDSITVTATDLEIAVRSRVPAEVIEPGAMTLPARTVFALVRECESEFITIEEQANLRASIKTEASNYNIPGLPVDDFPEFPAHDESTLVAFPSDTVQEMIDKVLFSVAAEGDSQFSLSGVLVEGEKKEDGEYLRFVSSDGHRLTMIEKRSENPLDGFDFSSQVIVPKRGMQELKKICENNDEVRIGVQGSQMVAAGGGTVMIARLISGGTFPDYRSIISVIEKNNRMLVDRDRLTACLRRMIIVSEERFHLIRFEISGDRLDLYSEEADKGSGNEPVEISYVGETMTIGFNGRYVLDVLNVMDSETVKMFVNPSENPCLVEGDDDEGFLSVVMPMKL